MYTVWGNAHCKKCKEVKLILADKGVPYEEKELSDDILYPLWREGFRDLVTELYGMLQWQDRELPVITKDDKAITWDELSLALNEKVV